MMVLKDDSTTFSQRIKKQKALKRFEERLRLMETNWDEFCLLVTNITRKPGFSEHKTIKLFASNPDAKISMYLFADDSSVFQFPGALHQCELAAREAGNKEKELLYNKKATDAAASISRIFQRTLSEFRLRKAPT